MAQTKKTSFSVRPYIERLAIDAVRGYGFGCMFAVFSSGRKPLLDSMHENGVNFAKMSVAYSIADMSMSTIRKKSDIYNSIAAGAVAGALGSKKGMMTGSAIFGAYSGVSSYFQNLDPKA